MVASHMRGDSLSEILACGSLGQTAYTGRGLLGINPMVASPVESVSLVSMVLPESGNAAGISP